MPRNLNILSLLALVWLSKRIMVPFAPILWGGIREPCKFACYVSSPSSNRCSPRCNRWAIRYVCP